ncbi:MAG: ATP-binding cassette domain-containing protein [Pseudomonadota bacterium]
MLFFENVTLRRGRHVLFDEATFTVHAKDKVGLVGANGCGKSSLFAMIRREIEEDAGNFNMAGNLVIASVRQETPAVDIPALDYVLQGDVELCELEDALAEAEQNNDGLTVSELHQKLDQIDGYSARARASTLLNGLGFQTAQETNPVTSFSGGWRMRLNLAQALMCRSNVLLLDEPTNHLDFETVLWLERWINTYPGAVLLISHDRDFLDRVIKRVVHIEHEKIQLYTGNYSDFERLRVEKIAQQQSQFERQQKHIAHMQSFVTRFKAKATKAKQAQSRVKALERMELIAPAHMDSPFSFEFATLDFSHSPLMQLNDAHMGYIASSTDTVTEAGTTDSTIILSNVNFVIRPGDRIGLLGPNGAGKSTLIKALAGAHSDDHALTVSGERIEAKVLNIGYFAQHQLEQLHPEMSPVQHFQHEYPDATEPDIRKFLGGFDFQNDKALEPVAPFSGGEKARLVLAIIVYAKPNILLLDEPTNHLDLDMRHAITMALQSYEGAVLLVSHDRHMVRTVCDSLYLIANHTVAPFSGDLDDYAKWVNEQRLEDKSALENAPDKNESNDTAAPAEAQISKKEQRKLDAQRREQLKPLKKAADKLEQQLEIAQARSDEIDALLMSSDLYTDDNKSQLAALNKEYGELSKQIDELEIQWMDALEALESA